MYLDSHCHITSSSFDEDRADVIARARQAGLEYMLTVGVDSKDMDDALHLVDTHVDIFAAAGIHPHDAEDYSDNDLVKFISRYDHFKMLAVGEIGLDFWYDNSPRQQQEKVFRIFLRVARDLDKPVIIHLRDPKTGPPLATQRFLAILAEEDPDRELRGIMHCFSGTLELAKTMVERGFLISFPGIITFNKAEDLRRTARQIPDESLLIETDCPYLAPVPHRGKRNEPAYVVDTGNKLADIRGISREKLSELIISNFEMLFRIDKSAKQKTVYRIGNSLYINITNRCTCHCSFCDRTISARVAGHALRLHSEPSAREILSQINEPEKYDEIVFCGYGEPLIRLDTVIAIARELKNHEAKIRINTTGHAELVTKRDVLTELNGYVDSISVSLNAANKEDYNRLCRPYDKSRAFDTTVKFIRKAVQQGYNITATAVELPGFDLESVKELAQSLGAKWRAREYNKI